jgi:hypothetical protein
MLTLGSVSSGHCSSPQTKTEPAKGKINPESAGIPIVRTSLAIGPAGDARSCFRCDVSRSRRRLPQTSGLDPGFVPGIGSVISFLTNIMDG